jgi:hypothetical protein
MRTANLSASLLTLVGALLLSGCDDGPIPPRPATGGAAATDTGGSGGAGGSAGMGGTGGAGGAPICTPGAVEVCYQGPPGTAGVGICGPGQRTCLSDGSAFGACEGQTLPVEEACSTVEDDDCDGTVNEADAGCACIPGDTASCYEGPAGTVGVGLCVAGLTTCAADGLSWGPCDGQVLPADETCGTPGDDDCDGETNEGGEGCACLPGSVAACYSGPPATLGKGPCTGGMQMCNDQGTGYGPCTGEVVPDLETCATPDDDDCDGQTNEEGAGCVCPPSAMLPCYTGPMGTLNVGVCQGGLAQCNDQGTVLGACSGDVTPGVETCNTAVDDDCDGLVNEGGAGCVCQPGTTASCYSGPVGTAGVGLCKSGTMTCNALGTAYGPCGGEVVPAAETCASPADEDCDGQSNEGCAPTYTADVQPIFAAKCGFCHNGGGSGGHNIGTSYADTQLSSYSCPGLTKGECALVRIKNGSMPGSPPVTPAEEAILQAWIDAGMPQ